MDKNKPKDEELIRFRAEAEALLGVKEKKGTHQGVAQSKKYLEGRARRWNLCFQAIPIAATAASPSDVRMTWSARAGGGSSSNVRIAPGRGPRCMPLCKLVRITSPRFSKPRSALE